MCFGPRMAPHRRVTARPWPLNAADTRVRAPVPPFADESRASTAITSRLDLAFEGALGGATSGPLLSCHGHDGTRAGLLIGDHHPVPMMSNQGTIGSCAGDRWQRRRETGETLICCRTPVELVPRPDG